MYSCMSEQDGLASSDLTKDPGARSEWLLWISTVAGPYAVSGRGICMDGWPGWYRWSRQPSPGGRETAGPRWRQGHPRAPPLSWSPDGQTPGPCSWLRRQCVISDAYDCILSKQTISYIITGTWIKEEVQQCFQETMDKNDLTSILPFCCKECINTWFGVLTPHLILLFDWI